MITPTHPNDALFAGEKAFPVLAACEHFAGSGKLIGKAMDLQVEYGAAFDVTCDCEDGAAAGQEREHAQMVARMIASERNRFGRAGARIHDPSHPAWRQDVDIIVREAGSRLAYITVPKATGSGQVAEVIRYIDEVRTKTGLDKPVPVHVLIETHGALRDVFEIAELPHIEVLDFGLMDFVSGHHGAIPAAAMRSPGQFEHALLGRAKADMVAAALANGIVPAHNVCLNLKDAEVIASDARRARDEFGFLRMWSIYPAQIQPIVNAMRPDLAEVEDAAGILSAAQDADWGPIQYKGELHDRATYRYFWEILRKAKVTGMTLPAEAVRRFFVR
ncbi:Citrate lyase beta subunit [Cupriavidus necator]|uniref:Citrate lyase beta subunit n=1 Tax=Cupriavidus necator (strain ATCC 17699 / DSM 428 / KCTC 22496 / NCIMB 10442 / H16 / Stanier 337) TaxID=381666 RepID=Q0K4C1_CUPNH|nr:aldolase/citrate lyase family protein [Cupriavidus necator]QCC03081.1 CoA ester lyase [Cupriavidus necator H16]QQB80137.1 CoA ester lyase [Cupriavidus necator]WKA44396.1 aldolase/citrate lyase family protein [Cupriavidus necator]CAJ95153.1 citrate lyase beta subunit [Cupriavidus necator H16]